LHNHQVEKFLVETCQELLGIDSIGLHDNVMQLGMDSMNVMQLSLRIEQAFKLKIAPHHLFSKPHIGSVIEKILALRPDLASAPIADASVSASPAKPAAQIKTDNATDDDELAEMASFVNNLSDLEVNRLLMELNAS
jgi:acyl carrier protein